MSVKVLVQNRRVRFDYEIIQTVEAGLELRGTEVKSSREGRVNLNEGYCRISERMEAFLINVHVSHYGFGNRHNHDPLRERKLLLHRGEIKRFYGQVREQGLTLVPLRLYLKKGRIKAELALVKGRKAHDKRELMKKRDAQREVERVMSERHT